jgi:hypothetical protein
MQRKLNQLFNYLNYIKHINIYSSIEMGNKTSKEHKPTVKKIKNRDSIQRKSEFDAYFNESNCSSKNPFDVYMSNSGGTRNRTSGLSMPGISIGIGGMGGMF